jgi:hypothetical protein
LAGTPPARHGRDTMTTDEIQQIGLAYAARWLQKSGYDLCGELPAGGPPEIAVDSRSARILVRVCVGVVPVLPKELRRDEVEGLKSRAASLGRRPYAAKVLLDEGGRLLDDVRWLTLR